MEKHKSLRSTKASVLSRNQSLVSPIKSNFLDPLLAVQADVGSELERKYIFKGDGTILLKDGSSIGGSQSEGVVRVLHVAKPSSVQTQSIEVAAEDNEEMQNSDPSGFLISDPSKNTVYGIGSEEIFELSKVTNLDISEDDLELHEDWEEQASYSSSQDEQEKRRPRREHHFPKLQDSNELRRRKFQAQATRGLGAAHNLIRQLQAELQGLKNLKQAPFTTQRNRSKAFGKHERSTSGSFVWKEKKGGSQSDSEIPTSLFPAPNLRRSKSVLEGAHLSTFTSDAAQSLFDPKSSSNLGPKVFVASEVHAHPPPQALSNGHKGAVLSFPKAADSHMGASFIPSKPGALSPFPTMSLLQEKNSASHLEASGPISHVAPHIADNTIISKDPMLSSTVGVVDAQPKHLTATQPLGSALSVPSKPTDWASLLKNNVSTGFKLCYVKPKAGRDRLRVKLPKTLTEEGSKEWDSTLVFFFGKLVN